MTNIESVSLRHDFVHDSCELLVNDIMVGSANHDDHGWAGIELLRVIGHNLAFIANVPLLEVEDDE